MPPTLLAASHEISKTKSGIFFQLFNSLYYQILYFRADAIGRGHVFGQFFIAQNAGNPGRKIALLAVAVMVKNRLGHRHNLPRQIAQTAENFAVAVKKTLPSINLTHNFYCLYLG